MTTVEQLYGEIWATGDAELQATLDASLDPRSLEALYEMFARLGIGQDDVVLDAGCRDAKHAIELARRLGCRVIGVDPVPVHVEHARAAVAEAGMAERIEIAEVRVEELPFADATIDAGWCRDVLNHVDLEQALHELARVLRPGGRMLVYITLSTEALEPLEAERLYAAVALRPASMDGVEFERAADAAGFDLLWKDELDSEAREHMIEEGRWDPTRDLLRIARLRRREQELVERHGRARYEATLADAVWGIYQMLGKLRPTIYGLELRAA